MFKALTTKQFKAFKKSVSGLEYCFLFKKKSNFFLSYHFAAMMLTL